MSTARLNVWIYKKGDACHIDDATRWFVHITDCHGNVLHWCGRKYAFLPARCGHLEVEIPPGCYTVFASWTPEKEVHPPHQPFGNHLTHVQIVRANCGDHVCVNLFQPTGHYCGTWWDKTLTAYTPVFEAARLDLNLARAAQTATAKFVATLEPDPYAVNVARLIAEGPPKTGEGGPGTGEGGPKPGGGGPKREPPERPQPGGDVA